MYNNTATNPNTVSCLVSSCNPYIYLPSGTWNDATGGMTLGTALTYQPTNTCYVYVTNSGTASANWYYATFSSTTVCQIYTDAALTTKLTTTAGAYTSAAAMAPTIVLSTLPGGSLGNNGYLKITARFESPNASNTKNYYFYISGVTLTGNAFTSQYTGIIATCKNRGSQTIMNCFTYGGDAGGGPCAERSINTAVSNGITCALGTTVATDWVMMDGYTIDTCYK